MQTIGSTKILGVGAYLPKKIVTSDELMGSVDCERFGIPENYISKFIGVVERRHAEKHEQPSDLATLASEVALRDSGVTPSEIDLIIFAGITKDCEEPATSHFVQQKLGATNAICLDVSNACLGFMTAISVADAYLKAGCVQKVLVCTGEKMSRYMDDLRSEMLSTADKEYFKSVLGFLTAGDGGGAMVLSKSDPYQGDGLNWIKFSSRGNHAKLCYVERTEAGARGQMIMKEISREIINMHSEMIENSLLSLDWPSSTIDKLYCHQVGAKPHKLLSRMAGVKEEQAPITYDKFGNLTSATMPINMFLNPPRRGDRIMFLGTGSGLSICQGGMIF